MQILRPFRGGAAVPHHKGTAESAIQPLVLPSKVVIPMLQHIGAPCQPVVAQGDIVQLGQVIGDSQQPVSAPIHSSVSGKVSSISSRLYAGGFQVPCIEIETDGAQTIHESVKPQLWNDQGEFIALVRKAGLVGLGGAGFPTHIKLKPTQKPIDTLILNGAECEPFITSDYRVMLEKTSMLVEGIRMLKDVFGFATVKVGVEENKSKAIEVLRAALASMGGVDVEALPTRYPQGAEKMMIWALTKRAVPMGKLPSEVGVIVLNVTSVVALSSFIMTGMPLVSKVVTVDGIQVRKPGNFEVPIGTSLHEVLEAAGGIEGVPGKVIMGGPMMGVAQHSMETTVVKHTNAIVVLDEKSARPPLALDCIRCSRCASACPMSLQPMNIAKSTLRGDPAGLEKYQVEACIECGSCSFVCPAKIQLVQLLRLGKAKLRASRVKGAS